MDIEQKIKELEQDIRGLYEVRDGLTNTIIKLNDKLKKMKSKQLDLSVITPEKYMSIRNIDQYGTPVYKALQNWINKNYYEHGLYPGGQHAETLQPYLKLMLDQNKPLNEQLGIKDFIPYLDPDSCGIFEHTCSEGGYWTLTNIKTKPTLNKTSWGRTSIVKKFDTIDEALQYIYDKHPYSRLKGVESDDDY